MTRQIGEISKQKTLSQNYRKHPYGKWALDLILPIILNLTITKLSTLNITIIKEICYNLKIYSNFNFSSNIPTFGTKSSKLIEICKHFNVNYYYSPLGSKKYIDEEDQFQKSKINVMYQNIQSLKYNQFKSKIFTPKLSILDLMSNLALKGL